MNEHFWLGMTVIFFSGVMNGSFPLPMKYSRSWRWENFWLVFSIISLLILPWALAASFVPHLAGVYQDTARRALCYPLIFGLMWGVAQATYGLSIKAVGMAVAIAVVSGLTGLSGSLVPLLVLTPENLLRPRGILLLVSLPVLLAGLVYYGMAGRRRESELPKLQEPSGGNSGVPKSFMAGLAICVFTGIFGSNFNLGLAFSGAILDKARQYGASPVTAGYAVWALVFAAGFIPNLLYCSYLLFRNHTWKQFRQGAARETALAIVMAAIWITAIFGYGMGAALVGKYGTSIGFTLLMASSILSSNILGLLAGEWKQTSHATRRHLIFGIALILVSVVILNLGGLF